MHYTGTIWRPPYEASSLLLEITAGCTHHRCKFCTLYEELPFRFRMSLLEDVESDLREAQRELGGRRHLRVERTFLTGANPFALGFDKLMAIAGLIRRYLPSSGSIGCFARVTDVARKTDEELAALREAGYDGLTIGMETGDDGALSFMNKGYGAEDIVRQCSRLDRAGIGYSFFYLTGISGAGKGEDGARATARICNQLHPKRIGANMLTVYKTSELYEEIRRGSFREETELEKYRELRVLVSELRVDTEFMALGASNAVPICGRLPEDRERILETLEAVIGGISEEELRRYRTHLRHL